MKQRLVSNFSCYVALITLIIFSQPIATMRPGTGAIGAPTDTSPPVIQGWGGVTLGEAANGQLQQTLQRLNQSGYDGVRLGFSAGVTSCSSGELGSWDPNWLRQAIQDAQPYNMWIVLDYHSYHDLVDSGCLVQWLSFWKGVVATNWGYERIVWEPINEPAGTVADLSSAYQAWITQARGVGDGHWIAVENTISNNGCNFDPLSLANCYPAVADPLNETFLSIHPYLFYDQWQSNSYGACSPSGSNVWGNATAECVADLYNQGMLKASSKYHMSILDTEGGAVYYSCNSVCASPPDAIGTDDASYSTTTFHFIQYLTTLMQSENMGWVWWEAGEGSCCGALDTWGRLLSFQPIRPSIGLDAAPNLAAPSGESVVAGSTLSFTVNASDPDRPPQNLTLSCSSCPVGASFPTVTGQGIASGLFVWTTVPGQDGQYGMTFRVADADENSSANVTVTVSPGPGPRQSKPPVLIIPGNQSVSVGSTIAFDVNATDDDVPAQTLVLSCLNCPSLGAIFTGTPGFSPISGLFTWAPSDGRISGNYVVHFGVTDGLNTTLANVPVTVMKALPVLAAEAYPRTAAIGLGPVSLSDAASVSGGFNPSGSITFLAYYSNASCGGVPLFASILQVSGNGYYTSQTFSPPGPGSYQWKTVYPGDVNNSPIETQCGHPSESVIITEPTSQPPASCFKCNSPSILGILGQPVFWLAVVAIAFSLSSSAIIINRRRSSMKS